jgi:hypothetical protein
MSASPIETSAAARLLTLDARADLAAPEVRREARATLEGGGVVFLPQTGFELTPREREMISDTQTMLEDNGEAAKLNGRPTIVYDPERRRIKRHYALVNGRLVRAQVRRWARPELEAMLARFAVWADDLVGRLFPSYVPLVARDRVTYRPRERAEMQALHVDSSYGHPTQGRGMLRLFCNIDPAKRPRVWQVGQPFEPFVRHFLPSLGRERPSRSRSLLSRLGIVAGPPTPYDQLIAELRRMVKRDPEYRDHAPRRIVEFPSGSCWFAITDLVLHGAVSGQHSLDRTYFLPDTAMQDPTHSSLRILERLTGRSLG